MELRTIVLLILSILLGIIIFVAVRAFKGVLLG